MMRQCPKGARRWRAQYHDTPECMYPRFAAGPFPAMLQKTEHLFGRVGPEVLRQRRARAPRHPPVHRKRQACAIRCLSAATPLPPQLCCPSPEKSLFPGYQMLA